MHLLYLLLALLSAIAFYLGSPHQRLWPAAARRSRAARATGALSAVLALAAAVMALGVWAGIFSALTAWMFGTVLLPYLDAWRDARRHARSAESRHVG